MDITAKKKQVRRRTVEVPVGMSVEQVYQKRSYEKHMMKCRIRQLGYYEAHKAEILARKRERYHQN